MNSKIFFLAISVAALSSCSTAYKTGQTPDDVYYSPARNTVVKVEKEEEKPGNDVYAAEDRQIRMGIYDARWRSLDYDLYSYNPYYYGYNNNYYYNPYYYPFPVYTTNYYCSPVYVVKPIVKAPVRITNLDTYNNNNYSNSNGRNIKMSGTSSSNRTYNNSNGYRYRSSSSMDNSSPSGNSGSSGSSRSYSPSSSGGSSSGGSGNSSTRPSRTR